MKRKKKIGKKGKIISCILALIIILIISMSLTYKESLLYIISKNHDKAIKTNATTDDNTNTRIGGVAKLKDIINNERVYGDSAIDSSIKISNQAWETSEKVIVVNQENLLEGFIALPLSNRYNSPILLNESKNLNEDVKKEIQRLHASKITIIGGESDISANVEQQLKHEGLEVNRIQGDNISELCINVANKVGNSDKYFVVSDKKINDLMDVGSIAANEEIPIMILEGDYKETYKFLKDKGKISCYFIGEDDDFCDKFSDLNFEKINTKDIYEGNYKLLTKSENKIDFSNLVIASPENSANVLCGQAMCGVLNYPLIFINKDRMYSDMEKFLIGQVPNIEKTFAIGDASTISENFLSMGCFIKPYNNAKSCLKIPTYDGSNQAVHPKVIYVKDGWNGYKYWMGITPYPKGNDNFENPQILVSNDGINYKTLEGCKNPLDIPEDIVQGGHYSDITICLVDNTMEVYFRYNPGKKDGSGVDNGVNMLYRIESKDGIKWSDKKIVLSMETFKGRYDYVSPIVIYDDHKYKIWFSNYSADLYYTETTDWKSFKEVEKCNFKDKPSNFSLWHHDLIKTNLGYEIVINGYSDGKALKQALYYSLSKDGINFSPLMKILDVNPNKGTFDDESLYKSSLVKVEDKYMLYYSATNKNGEWRIGLAENNN